MLLSLPVMHGVCDSLSQTCKLSWAQISLLHGAQCLFCGVRQGRCARRMASAAFKKWRKRCIGAQDCKHSWRNKGRRYCEKRRLADATPFKSLTRLPNRRAGHSNTFADNQNRKVWLVSVGRWELGDFAPRWCLKGFQNGSASKKNCSGLERRWESTPRFQARVHQ